MSVNEFTVAFFFEQSNFFFVLTRKYKLCFDSSTAFANEKKINFNYRIKLTYPRKKYFCRISGVCDSEKSLDLNNLH